MSFDPHYPPPAAEDRWRGSDLPPSPVSLSPSLASWWRRAAALLIDGLFLCFTFALVIVIFFHSTVQHANGTVTTTLTEQQKLLFGLYGIAYFTFGNGGTRGQTLGKRLFRITVRDITGAPLGAARALGRSVFMLAAFLLLPVLVVDVLIPLRDRQHQAIHDKLARSLVLSRPSG
jgi:uncharacterized RDD family membrane protein YckC